MRNKRLWIAFMAVPVSLASLLVIGAQRAHPSSAGGVIDPTCTSPSPCIQYTNNSSGAGVEGLSLLGNGLFGVTKIKSTSTSNGKSGIFGSDLSTSGKFDSGVGGLSVRGTGVLGQSTSGDGVFGSSASYVGVYGTSNSYIGVFGKGPTYGLAGVSTTGVGVLGTSNTSDAVRGIIGSGFPAAFHAGVAGLDSSSSGATNEGVYGQTNLGIGVQAVSLGSGEGLVASSVTGVGANVVGGNSSLPALSIVGNSGADLIDACLAGSSSPCNGIVPPAFFVDSLADVFAAGKVEAGCFETGALTCAAGNVDISGEYQVNGNCAIGCAAPTATSAGRAVVSYVPTQSLPSIDDFGEATLQNGSAYVRIDRAFSNVIDGAANYLVFITPEGDSRGLYVTQKTANGFTVRENMGGHSSLAFSYRIVAKPLGKQEQRLPMVVLPKLTSSHHVSITMPRHLRSH